MFTTDYTKSFDPSNWSLEDMAAIGQSLNPNDYMNLDTNLLNPFLPNDMTSPNFTLDPQSNDNSLDFSPLSSQNLIPLAPKPKPVEPVFPKLLPKPEAKAEPSVKVEEDPIKLKPGRKRKDEKVDREALKRERMIRNRLAAQRSRDRKRREAQSIEEENKTLKNQNQSLVDRVAELEASNLALMSRMEALTQQMALLYQPLAWNPNNLMMNNQRFGETAELDDRGKTRSQQRKRWETSSTNLAPMLMAMRAFLIQFWTLRLWAISSISNGKLLIQPPSCINEEIEVNGNSFDELVEVYKEKDGKLNFPFLPKEVVEQKLPP